MTRTILELAYPPIATGRTGFALLLLRLFLAVAFCFHGYGKVADIASFAEEFHMPTLVAALAAYTQVAGALLLLAGFLTPAAATALGTTMGVAMSQLIARGESFVNPAGHSWEAAAFYLTANVVLLLAGPGRWSVDALLLKRAAGRTRGPESLATGA